MLIAVTADRAGPEGVIPARYEDGGYLLIVETDRDEILAIYPAADADGLELAARICAHGCEAVVCGAMRRPGFEAVADHGVTRYCGAGLTVLEGARRAVNSTLPYLTDFEGGTGCGSHSNENCLRHQQE